jgi:glycosyltransferase involved in cell wall biosynthesis
VVFNEQQWWPPVLWARAQGIRTVAYVDHYTPTNVRWFGIYDALWCNTRRHYTVFKGHPGACYIPWGTDLELFQPRDEIWTEEIVFFHSAGMGGANLRKGTDLLIQAFQQVRGPARLVIHSQVPASVYGTAGALLAQDPRTEFIEGTAAAPGLYDRGDVYVYPARLATPGAGTAPPRDPRGVLGTDQLRPPPAATSPLSSRSPPSAPEGKRASGRLRAPVCPIRPIHPAPNT